MTPTPARDPRHVSVARASVPLGSKALVEWLRRQGWEHRLLEHEPTFRALDEAAATELPPEETAKTVVLHGPAGLIVVALPASERLDLRKVRRLLGGARVRLATEAEIGAAFPTFDVGAVPPIGPLLGISAVLDERLTRHSRIACSAGDHRHVLTLDPVDLERLGRSRVADVCED